MVDFYFSFHRINELQKTKFAAASALGHAYNFFSSKKLSLLTQINVFVQKKIVLVGFFFFIFMKDIFFCYLLHLAPEKALNIL